MSALPHDCIPDEMPFNLEAEYQNLSIGQIDTIRIIVLKSVRLFTLPRNTYTVCANMDTKRIWNMENDAVGTMQVGADICEPLAYKLYTHVP